MITIKFHQSFELLSSDLHRLSNLAPQRLQFLYITIRLNQFSPKLQIQRNWFLNRILKFHKFILKLNNLIHIHSFIFRSPAITLLKFLFNSIFVSENGKFLLNIRFAFLSMHQIVQSFELILQILMMNITIK